MKTLRQFIAEIDMSAYHKKLAATNKRLASQGFEPRTQHQQDLLDAGMFKKDAAPILVRAERAGKRGSGRFVGSAAPVAEKPAVHAEKPVSFRLPKSSKPSQSLLKHALKSAVKAMLGSKR